MKYLSICSGITNSLAIGCNPISDCSQLRKRGICFEFIGTPAYYSDVSRNIPALVLNPVECSGTRITEAATRREFQPKNRAFRWYFNVGNLYGERNAEFFSSFPRVNPHYIFRGSRKSVSPASIASRSSLNATAARSVGVSESVPQRHEYLAAVALAQPAHLAMFVGSGALNNDRSTESLAYHVDNWSTHAYIVSHQEKEVG